MRRGFLSLCRGLISSIDEIETTAWVSSACPNQHLSHSITMRLSNYGTSSKANSHKGYSGAVSTGHFPNSRPTPTETKDTTEEEHQHYYAHEKGS